MRMIFDLDLDLLTGESTWRISISSQTPKHGKPLAFLYLISPDLLVKPPELHDMPQTRNEYYKIGEAVLAHMRRSNPREVTTAEAGKDTLELMKSALRDDQSCYSRVPYHLKKVHPGDFRGES